LTFAVCIFYFAGLRGMKTANCKLETAECKLQNVGQITRFVSLTILAAVVACHPPALADERLEGIACRSVHLQLAAPEGIAFYHEAAVEKSAPGTYFCVCGFRHGYYGMQELANGKKLLIFSVWDPGEQNDPNAVQDEDRVKLLYQDEKVRVGRFGNEGTGGQSFYNFDWQAGETYRFLVTAQPREKRTEFTAWFFLPAEKSWKKLVTFSTLTGGQPLSGYYSFVEDFRRNRVSAVQARAAHFGNGWVRREGGRWEPIVKAKFTADSNPAQNINAGLRGALFFLVTGGETRNDATKLGEWMELSADGDRLFPSDLPEGGKD
jgi:hypothetical protein